MASTPPGRSMPRSRLPTSRASLAQPKNTRLSAAVNGSNPREGIVTLPATTPETAGMGPGCW